MRTTLRIDDDLMRELRRVSQARKISLSQAINLVIRAGLEANRPKPKPYRQRVFDMGRAKVDLDKARLVAEELEDEEIARKLALRK